MDCDTLTLKEFIKFTCSPEKPEWWVDFMNEYADLKGDNRTKSFLMLQRSIAEIELDLSLIQAIVNQLNTNYDERLGEILRKDFGYDFEYKEGETLANELQITVNMARIKLAEKNELLSQLEEMTGKEDAKPLKEIDFMVQIRSFAKWQGFAIPLDTTTVTEYLSIQRLYNLENKPTK